MIRSLPFFLARPCFIFALLGMGQSHVAHATPDMRFDVATFCCPCFVDDHLCQPQFDHLNWPSLNGHYVAMGGDAHRLELATNGNVLAIYYNTLNDDYPATNGIQKAALINQYGVSGFTTTGPRPDWIILNEISSGLWTSTAAYRAWVRDVVHTLKNTYGYQVILYSPFSNPGANDADWQAIDDDAYIAIENYLSGDEIKAQGFSVSWCQGKYQSSIASYMGLGVVRSRLMLGEHFGQTTNGTAWGRAGVSSNEWDNAINIRSQAARNVGFPGFLSFAWGKNGMMVTDDELIHFEDTYSSQALPTNSTLTLPFIVVQPQSQGVPRGSDATFIVFPAGNAPLSYQWLFNGTNIPGATASALTIANVQIDQTGPYSVVLSNAAGMTTLSSNAWLSIGPPPLAYEPFSYAVGANLVGQTNAEGKGWTAAGSGPNQVTVSAGNFPAPGLASAVGGSIAYGVSSGPSARFNFGGAITAGAVFYSFVLRVTDLGALNTSGGFFAAFNNSTGSQGTTPTIIASGPQTRRSGVGYNIGLKKAAGGSLFDTKVFQVGESVFLVGSYTFNTGSTTDDQARLWINPDASGFGAASPPVPTLLSDGSTDLTGAPPQIASFVFFRRGDGSSTLQPAAMNSDELRIGTSWASVTPPPANGTVPSLTISLSANFAVLSWTTNAPGFALEATSTPAVSDSWMTVMGPVNIIAGSYTFTNAASGGQNFYRLRKP